MQSSTTDGVRDLHRETVPSQPDFEGELAEYEPSEAPSAHPLNGAPVDSPVESPLLDPAEFPAVLGAVSTVHSDPQSIMLEEILPASDEQMKQLIEELRHPVEQVVLRYFVPLRTKSGLEVSEALQQMILGINQRFPVRAS